MAFRWSLLCLLMLKGVYSELIEKPPGTIVVSTGAIVTLNCVSNVTSSVIQWFNNTNCLSATCPASDTIYNGYPTSIPPSGIQILTNGTGITRNLYFSSTKLSDGNNYICAEYVGSLTPNSQAVAKLVVLASVLPLCQLQSSKLHCTIQYKGPVTPTAQFSDSITGAAFQGSVISTTDATSSSTTFILTPTQTGTANCTVSFNQYTFTAQCPLIQGATTTLTETSTTPASVATSVGGVDNSTKSTKITSTSSTTTSTSVEPTTANSTPKDSTVVIIVATVCSVAGVLLIVCVLLLVVCKFRKRKPERKSTSSSQGFPNLAFASQSVTAVPSDKFYDNNRSTSDPYSYPTHFDGQVRGRNSYVTSQAQNDPYVARATLSDNARRSVY